MIGFICAAGLIVSRQVGPTVKWQFHTDGPVLSTPVVSSGRVILGSSDSFVYALAAATGDLIWKFETQGPITGSAAVADGRAYILGAGRLYALDTDSGKMRWSFATGFERRFQAKHLHGQMPADQTIPDAWDFFLSTPAVANGTVFFGSSDGNIYALNAQDGHLRWKYHTGDVVHTTPLVARGRVFVGSMDSRFYALDEKTGALKWMFQAGRDPNVHNKEGFQGSPTLDDGTLFVGCRDTHLYALDADTGAMRWSFSKGTGWISNRPLVAGDLVWAGTNPFRAINRSTGKLAIDTGRVGVFSNPAASGNVGFVGTLYGSVFAFDLKSGSVLWEFQTEARTRLVEDPG